MPLKANFLRAQTKYFSRSSAAMHPGVEVEGPILVAYSTCDAAHATTSAGSRSYRS